MFSLKICRYNSYFFFLTIYHCWDVYNYLMFYADVGSVKTTHSNSNQIYLHFNYAYMLLIKKKSFGGKLQHFYLASWFTKSSVRTSDNNNHVFKNCYPLIWCVSGSDFAICLWFFGLEFHSEIDIFVIFFHLFSVYCSVFELLFVRSYRHADRTQDKNDTCKYVLYSAKNKCFSHLQHELFLVLDGNLCFEWVSCS